MISQPPILAISGHSAHFKPSLSSLHPSPSLFIPYLYTPLYPNHPSTPLSTLDYPCPSRPYQADRFRAGGHIKGPPSGRRRFVCRWRPLSNEGRQWPASVTSPLVLDASAALVCSSRLSVASAASAGSFCRSLLSYAARVCRVCRSLLSPASAGRFCRLRLPVGSVACVCCVCRLCLSLLSRLSPASVASASAAVVALTVTVAWCWLALGAR